MDFNTSNDEVHLPALKSFSPFCRPTKPPLDLRTLWKLLEKMDAEKEREGKGSVVGISGLDDDDHSGHEGGKMSTWGKLKNTAFLSKFLPQFLIIP